MGTIQNSSSEEFIKREKDMNTKTTSNNHSIVLVREHYTTGSVVSQDGTPIGYRQYGHGPGLVLEQGGMGSAHNFHQLAGLLSDTFTVYVPDRRGRGLSGRSAHHRHARSADGAANHDNLPRKGFIARALMVREITSAGNHACHEHGNRSILKERETMSKNDAPTSIQALCTRSGNSHTVLPTSFRRNGQGVGTPGRFLVCCTGSTGSA
jgi:hypothetical protein